MQAEYSFWAVFLPVTMPYTTERRSLQRTQVIHQRAAATSKGKPLIGSMSSTWDHIVSDCHALLNLIGCISQRCFLELTQRGKSYITNIQPIQVLAMPQRQFHVGHGTRWLLGTEYIHHKNQRYGYNVNVFKPGHSWNGFPDFSTSTLNLNVWFSIH